MKNRIVTLKKIPVLISLAALVFSSFVGWFDNLPKAEAAYSAPSHLLISRFGTAGNEPSCNGTAIKNYNLYTNDFVELYNPTNQAVNFATNNYSIQYADAGSTSWLKTDLTSGIIQPHGYFLIKEGQSSAIPCSNASLPTPIGASLPTADVTGSINMTKDKGKIALVKSTNLLSSLNADQDPKSSEVDDFVGFGVTATGTLANQEYRGAPVPDNVKIYSYLVRNSIDPSGGTSAITGTSPTSTVSTSTYGNGFNSLNNSNDFSIGSNANTGVNTTGTTNPANIKNSLSPAYPITVYGYADSSMNKVLMSNSSSVDLTHNTVYVNLPISIVKQSISPSDVIVSNLPSGLVATAMADSVNNRVGITVTNSGTANVASDVNFSVVIKTSAVSTGESNDSAAIPFLLKAPDPAITAALVGNSILKMATSVTMDTSANTFVVHLTNGTVKAGPLTNGLDFTIANLPNSLSISGEGDNVANTITFKVNGTSSSPVLDDVNLSVIVLASALETNPLALVNSTPITGITLKRFGTPLLNDSTRWNWLKQDIIDHNSFYNDAGIKARKYAAMSPDSSAFAYYRATNDIFYKDLGTTIPVPSSWSNSYQNLQTWIQGDAHLQNMGFFDDNQGNVVYDLNDFDASSKAPFYWDLLRYATSAFLANDDPSTVSAISPKISSSEIRSLVTDFVNQYRNELKLIQDNTIDAATYKLTADHLSGYTFNLSNTAKGASAAAQYAAYISKWSKNGGGLLSNGDKLAEASASEKYEITSNWDSYIQTTPYYADHSSNLASVQDYFRLKDIKVRVDQGLGSRGLKRYYAMIEGPTTNLSDDIVIDIKEAGGSDVSQQSSYASLGITGVNSEDALRTIQGTRAMQLNTDNHLGALKSSTHSFTVKRVSPNKYDITDIKNSSYASKSDFSNNLTYSAQALALAHSRSTAGFASNVLTTMNDSQWADFQTTLVNLAEDYAKQVTSDYAAVRASLSTPDLPNTLVRTVNANVSELTLSAVGVSGVTYNASNNLPLAPASTVNYFYTVPSGTTIIKVTPTLNAASVAEGAVLSINGAAAANAKIQTVQLAAANPIQVAITAKNGFKQTYLIYVNTTGPSPSVQDLVNSYNAASWQARKFDIANPPIIGNYPDGTPIYLGGFSALMHLPGDPINVYYTLTDRGPNGDSANPAINNGKGQKWFPLPTFTPQIIKIELKNGNVNILDTIKLKLANGAIDPVTGTSYISGVSNTIPGDSAVIPGNGDKDEIPTTGTDLHQIPTDPYGLDTEALAYNPTDDTFWISEEYRPSIVQVKRDGTILQRLVPKGEAAWFTQNAPAVPVFDILPAVFGTRDPNRGFEGLTITPDGKYMFVSNQSNLKNMKDVTSNAPSDILRLLKFDLAPTVNSTVAAPIILKEYAYVLDYFSTSKTYYICDLFALDENTILVDERDANLLQKKIYKIDLTNATNILGGPYDAIAAIGTPSLESLGMADMTNASYSSIVSNLLAHFITPVAKTIVLDPLSNFSYPNTKLEGLTMPNGHTLALSNDNDFNVPGSTDVTQVWLYNLPSYLTGSAPSGTGTKSSAGQLTLIKKANNTLTDISFTETLPTGNALLGTVTFVLPDGLTATTADTAAIGTDSAKALRADQIFANGKYVVIDGVTAATSVKLNLIGKSLPSDSSTVSVFVDTDGPESDFLLSEGVTSSLSAAVVEVTGVTLDKTTLTFTVGGAAQTLTATVNPNNSTNKTVTWSSSNDAAATVNTNGTVTPHAAGTAVITVTTADGGKTATSNVTVNAANVAVTGVTLDQTTLTFTVGGAAQTLTATVNPSSATNRTVTWRSSNDAAATVDANGIVTPHAAGTAVITVTTADGGKTATSNVTVNSVSTGGGGGGGGGTSPSPTVTPTATPTPSPTPSVTPTPSPTAAPTPKPAATPSPEGGIKQKEVVEVKLQDDAIQTSKTTGSDGKETTKITLDEKKLDQALQALNNSNSSSSDIKSKLVIEVKGDNGSAQLELPASALANAAKGNSDAIVTLKSGNASYDLPLKALPLSDLAKELGIPQDQLKISVHVTPVDQKIADQLQAKANETGSKLIAGMFDFSVTVEGNGKTIEIHSMGQTYTERSLIVAGSVDTDHSTGVRYDPATGETFFVPTIFETTADGQTVATLKRKGNSIYTVIESTKSFSDLNGHWAKQDIELLASKQIISGKSKTAFAPNANVTRAEFASMLVRALGLSSTSAKAAYSDVSAKDWFYNDVATASAEGIISGTGNGKFNPNGQITREEMAVMIMRALKTAGKPVGGNTAVDQTLAAFKDAGKISSWSKQSVAEAVANGLLQGVDEDKFVPADSATRAQAAVLLKRFLQKAEFIN